MNFLDLLASNPFVQDSVVEGSLLEGIHKVKITDLKYVKEDKRNFMQVKYTDRLGNSRIETYYPISEKNAIDQVAIFYRTLKMAIAPNTPLTQADLIRKGATEEFVIQVYANSKASVDALTGKVIENTYYNMKIVSEQEAKELERVTSSAVEAAPAETEDPTGLGI